MKKGLSTFLRLLKGRGTAVPAWLCQRNSVLLHPGSSGASTPFSAQWLRLRQSWQTSLQFPRPVSLGVKACSTQPHRTGASLTAEGCRPCLLANPSVAPRKDVRKQKGFCGDGPHNIFLQNISLLMLAGSGWSWPALLLQQSVV